MLGASRAAGARVYSQYAVGYDNVDVAAATRLGLPVGNTPGVLTETTAEMAVALTFAAARRVAEGDRMMRAGALSRLAADAAAGRPALSQTLGIVGAGRIGAAYARMMVEGHKMDLVYYDVRANEELERYVADYAAFLAAQGEARCPAGAPRPCTSCSARADVVSIHAALNAATRHLIGARARGHEGDARCSSTPAAARSSTRPPSSTTAARTRASAPGWTSTRTSRP